ncbi:MAG TPA: EF-hand domain-containing protein, partial [Sphingomicrobium sp.]|nr:EF-hand domain-containing protein [Sphingomicrobium sp.]
MHKLLLAGAAATIATAALAAQPAPPTPPGVAQGTTAVRPAPQVQTFVHRLPMKTETRDEVVAHVREMFARLDGNKDGYVTRAEADAAHQAMIGEMHDRFTKRFEKADFPRPDRAAMFDKLDTNKDGSISRQEYMSAKPEIRHESHVFVMRDGEAPVEVGAASHVPGTPEGPARVTILQDGAPPLEMNSRPGEPGAKGIRMHGMRMGM